MATDRTEEVYAAEEQALTAQEFGVFPNPSKGQLTITVDKPSSINIVDMKGGKLVEAFVEKSMTLTMQPGLYLVNLRRGRLSQTKKLVID